MVIDARQAGLNMSGPADMQKTAAKNRKLRLQLTWAYQNLVIENWKDAAWSDQS